MDNHHHDNYMNRKTVDRSFVSSALCIAMQNQWRIAIILFLFKTRTFAYLLGKLYGCVVHRVCTLLSGVICFRWQFGRHDPPSSSASSQMYYLVQLKGSVLLRCVTSTNPWLAEDCCKAFPAHANRVHIHMSFMQGDAKSIYIIHDDDNVDVYCPASPRPSPPAPPQCSFIADVD